MGIQLRKLLRSRVIVVFGATSRVGKATIEHLLADHHSHPFAVTVVAAVEHTRDPRVRRLKKHTGCYVVKCDFRSTESLQRVVRHADTVLLVPALSDSGIRFSKRVSDAVSNERIERLVIISSMLATRESCPSSSSQPVDPSHVSDSIATCYEEVEAYARSVVSNCVSLRIPLLMETLLYCRDEIVYAQRIFGCFPPTTRVPCIAVADVATAANEVLTAPSTRKFDAMYCLAQPQATISPQEIARMLTAVLGRPINYRQVSDEKLINLLKRRGAVFQVAQNFICFNKYLQLIEDHEESGRESAEDTATTAREQKKPPANPLLFTNDFRLLTQQPLLTPQQWLQTNISQFVRTRQNEIQLFVLGSGEGLFVEVEQFLSHQFMAPTTATPPEAGEAALRSPSPVPHTRPETSPPVIPTPVFPTTNRVTFCTIKSAPDGSRTSASPFYYQVPGGPASPLVQLLSQLTPLDVVLFIPPLRLGAQACMDVVKTVVDAALKADVWGVVMVSSIFTGLAWNNSVNRMAEMEQYLEQSGVPYAIVRLPLLMEYFTALSHRADPKKRQVNVEETEEETKASASATEGASAVTTTMATSQEDKGATTATSAAPSATSTTTTTTWNLLDRALADSPQYLIAKADAAKALVAVAFTFPLHRNHTISLYTERRTMREIEQVLQKFTYRGRQIEFARVDALAEAPDRPFWSVAFWTKTHVKEILECSVELSGRTYTGEEPYKSPIETELFKDVVETEPILLERWAKLHSKAYTQALASPVHREGRP